MKEMTTTTTATTVTATSSVFVCSTLFNDLLNDMYHKLTSYEEAETGRFDLTWDAWKYRDSHFATLQNRTLLIEYRLSMVNTLVMDYHIHRPEALSWDSEEEEYCPFISDEDPKESEATLMKAKEILELSMQYIVSYLKKANHVYAVLAFALLLESYKELRNYNHYFDPRKELKNLLK